MDIIPMRRHSRMKPINPPRGMGWLGGPRCARGMKTALNIFSPPFFPILSSGHDHPPGKVLFNQRLANLDDVGIIHCEEDERCSPDGGMSDRYSRGGLPCVPGLGLTGQPLGSWTSEFN